MQSQKILCLIDLLLICSCQQKAKKKAESVYIKNRNPLKENPYIKSPLGAIQPRGWLNEQLQIMKENSTGQLDVIYEKALGQNSGWLGGTGDQWERAPYWLDGLVTAKVADGKQVTVVEETQYPFDNRIKFTFELEDSTKSVQFPFHLRIPAWSSNAAIYINGEKWNEFSGSQIAKIEREWKSNDVVELVMPMKVDISRWHENSVAIERSPLLYALKINEDWNSVENDDKYGDFREVHSVSPWNYGLVDFFHKHFEGDWDSGKQIQLSPKEFQDKFNVNKKEVFGYPWNLEMYLLRLQPGQSVFLSGRWKMVRQVTYPYRKMVGHHFSWHFN